ncbi:hypothetical protein QNK06_21940 [Bacillus subtilis]|uniref:hypothetical protein n=1 Tax=Bacillus TaxID=1386 RepID=UPI000BADE2BF|nr:MULTISPECIES: hypothetical protein [Bacillus]MCM3189377.1 hypothetical protein [Bacillus subtilis]PAY14885.1 hypothetical protein CJU60_00540 [Bacillus sp. 7705b]WHY09511.1 hypothetical protein QNK06_21940 [Bacillus subtilis]WPP25584.1 hypothetical protein SIS06_21625 [Bacillus subtilis]
MYKYNEMRKLFELANSKYLIEQKELIQSGVSERTLCGQLMLYLNNEKDKTLYRQYYVDIEYNRNINGRLKTIKDREGEIITINCDLVFHSRGENLVQDNLIALEMKKSNGRRSEKEKDRERLKALTRQSFDNIWSYDGKTLPKHVCRYILGVYYELNISRMEALVEYYQNGELIQNYTLSI